MIRPALDTLNMTEEDTQRFFDGPELGADLSNSSEITVSFARVDSAEELEDMAAELSRAADHCLVAAKHMIGNRVPKSCAHTFAAEGHIRKALRTLEKLAVRHADHALLGEEE